MHTAEIPLDGQAMHLRPSEVEAVVTGLGDVDASHEGHIATLVAAVAGLPATDRAPTWELVMRRYGRRTPLAQAAGNIGMDLLHAQRLLDQFNQLLAAAPAPER